MKLSKPARLAVWTCAGASVALVTLWWVANHRRGLAWAIIAVRKAFPDVPQLEGALLAEWMADAGRAKPMLIDARSTAEFAVSQLPGALHIDPDASDADLLASIPRDGPVVVYCAAGYRGSRLARRLQKLGFLEAMNLAGGIFQWANDARELHREGVVVHEVHPVSSAFARLLRPESRMAVEKRRSLT